MELPRTGGALETAAETKPSLGNAYYELTKPRLSMLSVITALIGYLAALPERDIWLLAHFLLGTALCAAGAAALNQWYERDTDAIMKRTRERPLPTGLVSSGAALAYGLTLSVAGTLQLTFGANLLAGALGLATVVSYVLIYTPMKRVTRWATEIGAISGSLPPLIGWAAAEGSIGPLGWILFAILSVWQIPHFMAIAWTFRHDYASAGFPMLTVVEPTGRAASRWSLANAVALVAISLLPVALGYCGWIYGSVATVFGAWILLRSYRFAADEDKDAAARKLFFNSIFYLPAVLFALVIDRWILA